MPIPYGAYGSPFNSQVFEGAFAYGVYPAASAPAGENGFVAGDGGVILGRFGWGDTGTGKVANARTLATQQLGITIPQFLNPRNRVYGGFTPDGVPTLNLRQGKNMTLASIGAFWLRFAGGAFPGARVYANPLDGSAISGQTAGAELSPFTVCTQAAPGGLAIISSTAQFGV